MTKQPERTPEGEKGPKRDGEDLRSSLRQERLAQGKASLQKQYEKYEPQSLKKAGQDSVEAFQRERDQVIADVLNNIPDYVQSMPEKLQLQNIETRIRKQLDGLAKKLIDEPWARIDLKLNTGKQTQGSEQEIDQLLANVPGTEHNVPDSIKQMVADVTADRPEEPKPLDNNRQALALNIELEKILKKFKGEVVIPIHPGQNVEDAMRATVIDLGTKVKGVAAIDVTGASGHFPENYMPAVREQAVVDALKERYPDLAKLRTDGKMQYLVYSPKSDRFTLVSESLQALATVTRGKTNNAEIENAVARAELMHGEKPNEGLPEELKGRGYAIVDGKVRFEGGRKGKTEQEITLGDMKTELGLSQKIIVTHGDKKIVGIYNPKKGEYYSEKNPKQRVKIYEGDEIHRPDDDTMVAGLEENPTHITF